MDLAFRNRRIARGNLLDEVSGVARQACIHDIRRPGSVGEQLPHPARRQQN